LATYKRIQKYIKERHRLSVKTCWIADAKEKLGLEVIASKNKILENGRKYPCPSAKLSLIKEAFMHFYMIS
jgi:hypothetical protein